MTGGNDHTSKARGLDLSSIRIGDQVVVPRDVSEIPGLHYTGSRFKFACGVTCLLTHLNLKDRALS